MRVQSCFALVLFLVLGIEEEEEEDEDNDDDDVEEEFEEEEEERSEGREREDIPEASRRCLTKAERSSKKRENISLRRINNESDSIPSVKWRQFSTAV